MKKIIKKLLNLLNDRSVMVFCRLHFRKQTREYCKKNRIPEINTEYKCEIKKYWKRYEKNTSTVFHRWYSGANGIEDAAYIPEDFFYDKIERYFNDMSLEPAYSDKGLYARLFPNIKQPKTIIVNINGIFYDNNYNIITKEQAANDVAESNRYVIKPTRDSGGGKNVTFISNTLNKPDKIFKIFDDFGKDYIVQSPLQQHSKLAAIHENSINTIRVMSMLENDNVSIVSTVLRIGVGESCVDNECSGGINCGVDESGHLSKIAFDGSGKKFDRHPQGFVFETGYVPSYEKIKEIVYEEHKKLPYFGLISWDFTVDELGEPIMIEINLRWCGLNFHQLHHGPLFGDRTCEILNKVCCKDGEK